jgi:hypothetical protein
MSILLIFIHNLINVETPKRCIIYGDGVVPVYVREKNTFFKTKGFTNFYLNIFLKKNNSARTHIVLYIYEHLYGAYLALNAVFV